MVVSNAQLDYRADLAVFGHQLTMLFINSGNNVVSYFMPEMFKQAGITDDNTQLLLNAINPIFSMIAAIWGATLLDKLGRRFMMLAGLAGSLASYIMLTAFTAESANHKNLSYGVIVSIYVFGICFAWGFTPLQTLYAVECLENRTRAKGSGLSFLFLNVAIMINTYGISVGMEKIAWKLYLVYIAWIVSSYQNFLTLAVAVADEFSALKWQSFTSSSLKRLERRWKSSSPFLRRPTRGKSQPRRQRLLSTRLVMSSTSVRPLLVSK